MASKTYWWCGWCGDKVRPYDDFCGESCTIEWMRDVGGYDWLIELLSLQRRAIAGKPDSATPRAVHWQRAAYIPNVLGFGGTSANRDGL